MYFLFGDGDFSHLRPYFVYWKKPSLFVVERCFVRQSNDRSFVSILYHSRQLATSDDAACDLTKLQ